MLVLSRKIGEQIAVGDAVVKILDVRGPVVKLGVAAPPQVNVCRLDRDGKRECNKQRPVRRFRSQVQ